MADEKRYQTIKIYPYQGTDYDVTFEYLARKFVVVVLVSPDQVTRKVLVMGNDYRFLNATQIRLMNITGAWSFVEVYRFTSATDRLVNFVNGSILRDRELNISQIQSIHIAEEARDSVSSELEETVKVVRELATQARESADEAAASEKMAAEIAGSLNLHYLYSFEKGNTLTNQNQILLLEATGDYYKWTGANTTFPKVVPAGSTPASTGGEGVGLWVNLGSATLKNMLYNDAGSLVGFKNPVGDKVMLGQYMSEGYIRVKSREELLAAIDLVNSNLKKPTEIRLSRDFAPWTAPTTDLDVTWVSIHGEGQATRIDVSGIPEGEGNYAAKLFTTPASSLGNIPYQGGDKLTNVMFIGRAGVPYPDRKVDGLIFESTGPGRSGLGNFATRGVTVSNFRNGVVIGANAYIIHMFEPRIDRCTVHLLMKAASNSGEGVITYGGTLGTSAGVLIRNENPNGAVRAFGTSLDYAGSVADAVRGSIELYGCHVEFENGTNDLKDIPFKTYAAQDSRILIHGGEMLSFKGTNPISQPTIFQSAKGGMGITVRDMKMAFLVTPTGNISQGDGMCRISGTTILDGAGNASISRGTDANNSIAVDPAMNHTSPVDWSITRVATGGQPPTDRWTSQTGTIKKVADPKVSGGYGGSVAVTKLFGSGAEFSIQAHCETSNGAQMHTRLRMLSGGSTTGTIYVAFAYGVVRGYDTLGRPILHRLDIHATRNVDLASLHDGWADVQSYSSKMPAPAWATHYVVSMSLVNMSKDGTLYIGETGFSTM